VAPPQVVALCWAGTLVNREEGLRRSLRASGADEAAARAAAGGIAPVLVELAGPEEPYRPWSELLSEALGRAAEAAGHSLPAGAAEEAARGLPGWPPYPEAAEALGLLAGSFRLAIVANGERAVLEEALEAFPFDLSGAHLVSSEDLESHKPAPDTYLAALHELEIDEEELLVLSDDPLRDLVTVHDLGIPAGWIRRTGGELPEEVGVDFRASDLLEAARRLTGRRPGRPRRG
jgi:2-haloalkanoic acid dehalogenase type II